MIRSAENRNTRDYFSKINYQAAPFILCGVLQMTVREYQNKKQKTEENQGKERKEKEAAIEKNIAWFAFKLFGEPLQTIAQP